MDDDPGWKLWRHACAREPTMPMIEVEDEEEYAKAIAVEGDKLVVVEWGASWCKNCKRVEPAVSRTLTFETS